MLPDLTLISLGIACWHCSDDEALKLIIRAKQNHIRCMVFLHRSLSHIHTVDNDLGLQLLCDIVEKCLTVDNEVQVGRVQLPLPANLQAVPKGKYLIQGYSINPL